MNNLKQELYKTDTDPLLLLLNKTLFLSNLRGGKWNKSYTFRWASAKVKSVYFKLLYLQILVLRLS